MSRSESSSSRPTSPGASSDTPKPRVVSGSLRDRIAKFNNADAVPLMPSNPYVGNASMQSSYARGGMVGNRLPNLDPKTAGLHSLERRRTPSDVGRGMIGNRIPSGSTGASSTTSRPSSGVDTSTGSVRSSSPTESATSSAPASSSAAIDSASISTSRSSSPATSPDALPPQLLVSSLPDTIDAGAMTPSSTIAEAGEEVNERSMPATPIAGATAELPPPVHDLVPGNLTLADGPGGAVHAPSLTSSLASQYDPESVNEEEDNLKDVSGVSTPTGTPRQAHRDLDDRSVTGSSVAGSTRSGGTEELEDKMTRLDVEDKAIAEDKAINAEAAPVVMERSPTPTPSDIVDSKAKETTGTEGEATGTEYVPVADAAPVTAEKAETSDITPTTSTETATKEEPEAEKPAVIGFQAGGETATPTEVKADEETATPTEDNNMKEPETTPTEETVKTDREVAKPEVEGHGAEVLTDNKTSERSEILADPNTLAADDDIEDDASDSLTDDQSGRPRNSADTLRPMEFHRGTDSVMASPVAVPHELRGSLDPDHEPGMIERDRDATPQPPGDSDDEREETPMPPDFSGAAPPALDDTSDVVSLPGVEHAFEDGGNTYDVSSNRSSMPPARASSELEFRYEEYADQFFRDQQQRDSGGAAGAEVGSTGATAAAIGASALSLGDGRREATSTTALGTQETRPESSVKDNGVSLEVEEKNFPSVPTDNINVDGSSSSAHKPIQVHIEPSPYGPISERIEETSEANIIDLTPSPCPSPAPPAPDLTIEAPSPMAAEFNNISAHKLPSAPSTELPEVKTPASSIAPSRTPTPPRRTSSLQGRVFPVVPDEEHPYVGVHVSPHSAASPTIRTRTLSPSLSNRSASPTLSVGTPRKKRNSFSPRSPHLDDEDPGDFEPGEGWAVVTDWEPWRGSPPRNPSPSPSTSSKRSHRWRRSFAEATGRK